VRGEADDLRLLRLPGHSGRVWVVDTREQAAPGGNTTSYYGWEAGSEEGPRFWLHCTIGGVAASPLDCRTTVSDPV
jgi:hypothetical protein